MTEYKAVKMTTEAGTITDVVIQPADWIVPELHGTILRQGTLEECKTAVREAGLAEKYGYDIIGSEGFDARVHKTPKKTLVLEGR